MQPVQIVIASRLKAREHRAEFLRLSALTQAWLERQPGFLRYELFETAEGWFDTMLWRDQSAADAGNADFAKTEIAARFAEIIQPGYRILTGQATPLSPRAT